MRISEVRYHKDQLRLQIAARFLEHEARTQTIRRWTGLSDDRIRKLRNTYLIDAGRLTRRHRGKSPRQVAYFWRSGRVRQETVWLASLFLLLGVITTEPLTHDGCALPSLVRAELLCHAFETYRAMIPSSHISFEHAVFLAMTLAGGKQLRLGTCVDCGGVVVIDPLSIHDKRCNQCAR